MSQISPVVLILTALLCCTELYMWWAETYTDSALAQFSRTFGEKIASRRLNSVTAPTIAIGILLAYPVVLLDGSTDFRVVKLISAGLSIFVFILGFVYLLPLPIPHCLDAQWQWHKRHGFIDENGKSIPPSPHQTNYCSYTLGGETVTIKTSMELPDTWRALSLPNPKAILTPQIPPIVNATSTHPRSPLDDALFVAVGIPEKTTGFRPNFIVTIDLMGESPIPLDGIIPGWMTIEQTGFSIPSDDTLMTTGLYVDEGLSYTAIQWTWTQTVSNRTVRLYATASATTTSINSIADQLPRMLETLQVIS